MLTDRDERGLLAAAENRIAEPLRIGAALAAVRRLVRRERESVTCHATPAPTAPRTPQTTPAAQTTQSAQKAAQATTPLPR